VVLLADGPSGLQVLDVSTPSAPTLLGGVDTPGSAYGITVHNDVAFVADYDSGLQVINVSTPSAPTLLGSVATPGSARGITVRNDVAFVADWIGGLQIFDLGQTRFLGMLPANATGPYYFTLSATNEHGEWIATDFELRVGLAPTVSNSSIPGIYFSAPSPSPSDTLSFSNSARPSISSDSGTRPNSNNPSLSSSASTLLTNPPTDNGQSLPGFSIVSIGVPYLEVGVETTLTIDNLSVQGYTGDPIAHYNLLHQQINPHTQTENQIS